MAMRTNNLGDDGTGEFPYFEIDFNNAGKVYNVRCTALPPYRNPDDTLNAHIDYDNITDGVSGRYANVVITAKLPGDNGRRRGPLLRDFVTLLGTGPGDPSPVFP